MWAPLVAADDARPERPIPLACARTSAGVTRSGWVSAKSCHGTRHDGRDEGVRWRATAKTPTSRSLWDAWRRCLTRPH